MALLNSGGAGQAAPGVDLLLERGPQGNPGMVILIDFRTALLHLHTAEQQTNSSGCREPSLAAKLHRVASRSCDLRLHWLPGHSDTGSMRTPVPEPGRPTRDGRYLLLRMRLDCCNVEERLHRHWRKHSSTGDGARGPDYSNVLHNIYVDEHLMPANR
ncbi:uncharacterized protein LOC144160533 [Haemaphysalis longicornis]